MNIQITIQGNVCRAITPYSPAFVRAAKARRAQWEPSTKAWIFPAAAEDSVRALCREVFGTDGVAPIAAVTIRVAAEEVDYAEGKMELGGRCIASRSGRDVPVRLGEGVTVIAGGISTLGRQREKSALQP